MDALPPSSPKQPSGDKHLSLDQIHNKAMRAFGRSVQAVQEVPSLRVYLDKTHAFVWLRDPVYGIDMARGLYPKEGFGEQRVEVCMGNASDLQAEDASCEQAGDDESDQANEAIDAALVLGTSKLVVGLDKARGGLFWEKGAIKDEVSSYGGVSWMSGLPFVDFNLTEFEARSVEGFLGEAEAACQHEPGTPAGDLCTYSVLGHNCIDFVQDVFSRTNQPGHFIEYFSPGALRDSDPQIVGYAMLHRPAYRVPVQLAATGAGSLLATGMLLLTLKPLVPKAVAAAGTLASAAGKACGWASSWLWSQEAQPEPEMPDPEVLEKLFTELRAQDRRCEALWETYLSQPFPDKKTIHEVTDMQFRFAELEEQVKRDGIASVAVPGMVDELQSLQQVLSRFIETCEALSGKVPGRQRTGAKAPVSVQDAGETPERKKAAERKKEP